MQQHNQYTVDHELIITSVFQSTSLSLSPALNARGYSLKCYIRLFTDSLNVHNFKKS